MFVFIFPHIAELTDNYHPDGGLVVIAENITSAIEMARAEGVTFANDEIARVHSHKLAEHAEPRAFIFPDAGCC